MLEVIMIFLFVTVLGYVIYNITSLIAMKNANENEDSKEQESEENNKKE